MNLPLYPPAAYSHRLLPQENWGYGFLFCFVFLSFVTPVLLVWCLAHGGTQEVRVEWLNLLICCRVIDRLPLSLLLIVSRLSMSLTALAGGSLDVSSPLDPAFVCSPHNLLRHYCFCSLSLHCHFLADKHTLSF